MQFASDCVVTRQRAAVSGLAHAGTPQLLSSARGGESVPARRLSECVFRVQGPPRIRLTSRSARAGVSLASRSSVHVDAWRLLMRDLVRASFECDSLGILATSNRVGHVRRFPTILLIDSADGPFPRHGRDAPLRCPRWSDSAQLTVSGRLSISTHRFSSTALQIQGLHRAGLSFSLCRSAPATVICIPFQIMWLSETDATAMMMMVITSDAHGLAKQIT